MPVLQMSGEGIEGLDNLPLSMRTVYDVIHTRDLSKRTSACVGEGKVRAGLQQKEGVALTRPFSSRPRRRRGPVPPPGRSGGESPLHSTQRSSLLLGPKRQGPW